MTNQKPINLREIAEKAGLSYVLVPGNPFIESDLLKFAKLVAEDCAKQVNIEACITDYISVKMNEVASARLRFAFNRIEKRWGLV